MRFFALKQSHLPLKQSYAMMGESLAVSGFQGFNCFNRFKLFQRSGLKRKSSSLKGIQPVFTHCFTVSTLGLKKSPDKKGRLKPCVETVKQLREIYIIIYIIIYY